MGDTNRPATAIAFNPSFSQLAVVFSDGAAEVWDAGTWQKRWDFRFDAEKVEQLAYRPDGRRVAFCGGTDLRVCDTTTGAVIGRHRSGAPITAINFLSGGNQLLVRTEREAFLFDTGDMSSRGPADEPPARRGELAFAAEISGTRQSPLRPGWRQAPRESPSLYLPALTAPSSSAQRRIDLSPSARAGKSACGRTRISQKPFLPKMPPLLPCSIPKMRACFHPMRRSSRGRKNIQQYWQGLIDAGILDVSVTTIATRSNGELGYEIGRYQMTVRQPDGKALSENGKYVELLKRSPDGTWKSIYGIWNADPLPSK